MKGLKREEEHLCACTKRECFEVASDHWKADTALYETVKEMAEAAAFRDPRFRPVTEDELPYLDVELSVLTPFRTNRKTGRNRSRPTRDLDSKRLLFGPIVAPSGQLKEIGTVLLFSEKRAGRPVCLWMLGKRQMPKFMSSQPMYSRQVSAMALLSGGLDSALAISLVKRQGIDVTAFHFASVFSTLDVTETGFTGTNTGKKSGSPPVLSCTKGDDFLEIIRNPRYGWGKNLNPCIDCRIYTFVRAKKLMEEMGASFIVTGEVAGQRPMSQRKNTMRLIDKRSGCEGIILRPLSAKVLPTTFPENEGFVDRERLLGITGRGRKTQLALAEE